MIISDEDLFWPGPLWMPTVFDNLFPHAGYPGDIYINRHKDPPLYYVFTTARNTMLNQIKKDKRTESMNSDNFNEPYANNDRFELKELIDKSLDQLPEIQKSIILLRDLEGYDYKEIGEILGLNESQVKVYLFRGRQKIKETLKNTITYHESN